MIAKCVTAIQTDPYRAGLEIGLGLQAIAPDVVILCATDHAEKLTSLIQGLHEGLQDSSSDLATSKPTLVIGGSADGFFTNGGRSSFGATALGLNGEGRLQFQLIRSPNGMVDSPSACALALGERVKAEAPDGKLGILYAPMQANGSEIAKGLKAAHLEMPWVGALTGYAMAKKPSSVVFHNSEILNSEAVMLVLSGDVVSQVHVARGWAPAGPTGRITRAEGTRVFEIDGLPANRFFHHETGNDLSITEMTDITLAFYPDPESEESIARSPYHVNPDGSVDFFGSFEEGSIVRCCNLKQDKLLKAATKSWKDQQTIPFTPEAGIVIGCAGRAHLLGAAIDLEAAIPSEFYPDLEVHGFPSFGEFYSPNKDDCEFYNFAYVSCLIGTGGSS